MLSNGRGWGQDATLAPGWERVGQAAWNAAASPATWAPAAAAAAMRTGHADQNLSTWAAEHTPVYGSQENAGRMSDDMLKVAEAAWVTTGLAAPSGKSGQDWLESKVKGFAMEGAAGAVTLGTVDVLKNTTDRRRPDGSDYQSFPSGHAAGSAFFTTVASRNIDALSLSPGASTASHVGLATLTLATAWARVEADKHYPSDVLAGMAIGHFFGAFLTDAFLGLDNPRHALVLVEPSREGVLAMVQFDF